MGLIDNVNVQVTGSGDLLSTIQTYVTKILKPNIVDGKNILTQEMVSAKNTKYVIKYDYELAENITIPENCILNFDGGSLNGEHTIIGNSTQIKAQDAVIFNNGIIITGIWNCPKIVSYWFGDVTENNRIKQVFNLTNPLIYNSVYIAKQNYSLSVSQNENVVISVYSNTDVIIDGELNLIPNSLSIYTVLQVREAENVNIKGSGSIKGDYLLGHTGTQGEWGMGISIEKSKNVHVDGLNISNCWGDSIYIGGNDGDTCENITICNCNIYTSRRSGIAVVNAKNTIIRNNNISNIYGTDNQTGIDIEPNQNCYIDNIIVENNYIKNKRCIDVNQYMVDNISRVHGVIIRNNIIIFSSYTGIICTNGCCVEISNNSIYRSTLQDTNPNDEGSDVLSLAIEAAATKVGYIILIKNNYINAPVEGSVSNDTININGLGCHFCDNTVNGGTVTFSYSTITSSNTFNIEKIRLVDCLFYNNVIHSKGDPIEYLGGDNGRFEGNIVKCYTEAYTESIIVVDAGILSIKGNTFLSANGQTISRVCYTASAVKHIYFVDNTVGSNINSPIVPGNASENNTVIAKLDSNRGETTPSIDGRFVGTQFYNTSLRDGRGGLLVQSGAGFREYDSAEQGVRRYGTFAQRPTNANHIFIGFQYFNTESHKIITWDGTTWRNPDGSEAS